MTVRLTTRILAAALVTALAAPAAAVAGLSLRGVDMSGYPTIRATLVSPAAGNAPPTVTEDGRRVIDLRTVNLASSKSLVVAIDRSRSMAGKRLADATAAARAFIAE